MCRPARDHGGVIDLHCHLLPGIDDGPATVDDAVALAEAMLAAGTTRAVATPHVDANYGNTPEIIHAAWLALIGELGRRRVALQVQTGAELDLLTAAALSPEVLGALALGRSGVLLIECPFSPLMPQFEALVGEVQAHDHPVLLAHPERSPVFQRDPDLLRRLVAGGAHASLTAASLAGQFGRTAARYARWALDEGLAHDVASDAHNTRRRPPVLRAPLQDAGYGWLADWLTSEAPSALLDGRDLPLRPPKPVARRTGRRIMRRAAPAG
jgi:protein-tyrosine phosphatase